MLEEKYSLNIVKFKSLWNETKFVEVLFKFEIILNVDMISTCVYLFYLKWMSNADEISNYFLDCLILLHRKLTHFSLAIIVIVNILLYVFHNSMNNCSLQHPNFDDIIVFPIFMYVRFFTSFLFFRLKKREKYFLRYENFCKDPEFNILNI